VTEERPVHEVLLDCLVYAPLGAAIVAVEEMPRLAERGRERVEKQLAIARLVGKFAVGEGRRRFGTAPASSREDASRADASRAPAAPPAPVVSSRQTGSESSPPPEAASRSRPEASLTSEASASVSEPSEPLRSPLGRLLPIPAYDTLAASQVVERLASLSAEELEAVRQHESGTRRRRTVLHRIAQLSSEGDGAA